MITEKYFSPYLGTTTIDGKKAFESRGIWEVHNDYMAGPFINYIIDDKKNNRQLVLEGIHIRTTNCKTRLYVRARGNDKIT